MSYENLQAEFQVVSVELNNPFAKLGEFSLGKFRKFSDLTSDFMKRTLSLLDTNHPNGLYTGYTKEVDDAFRTKKVVYSDLQPVQVFVPDFLKPNTKMLDYAQALRNDLEICKRIVKNAPDELESIVNGYLGNPQRLRDPLLINVQAPAGLSLIELDRAVAEQRKINEKIMTSTGTSSVRTFKDAYARIGDYTHTNQIAIEVNGTYGEQCLGLKAYLKRVEDANQAVDKLLDKINRVEGYEMNGAVASYLTQQVYRLAMLTEFYGATMYNAQVFLKSLQDTNIALQRVTQ